MTISEAIEAVSEEYDREILYARTHAEYEAMMRQVFFEEYAQLDRQLPSYVADIARASGAPVGTEVPYHIYQMARMCFRLGMRVQRKLDHPQLETTCFWQTGVPQ